MIQTTVTGNVGRDAKIVESTNGSNNFCTFPIAIDDSYMDKNNTKIERTIWVDVIINDTRKGIIPYIKKGCKILVQGKPNAQAWIDKDGKPASKIVINALYSELLSKPTEQQTASTLPTEPTIADAGDGLPF